MEDDSQGKMLEEVVRSPDEEQRRSLAALKRAHKTVEEANNQKEQELVKLDTMKKIKQ